MTLHHPTRGHSPSAMALWLLFCASALLHFCRLGLPAEVVFDESLVGTFSHAYAQGNYLFDIHPPHLKLIYAAIGHLFGIPEPNPFATPEASYRGAFYIAMRAFPALAGTLIPLLAVGIAQLIGCRPAWAIAVGWAFLFDTALMPSSQFILNDIPMLCFGMSGWWLYGRWRLSGRLGCLLLACAMLAAASSVKWTGFGFIAPVVACMAWDARLRPAKQLRVASWLFCVVVIWQMIGYAAHFSLVGLPHGSDGRQNSATPIDIVASAVRLNVEMAERAGSVGGHPYGSAWYGWPIGLRGIYIWNDRSTTLPARTYILPNLWTWWSGAAAMILIALRSIAAMRSRIVAKFALRARESKTQDLLLLAAFLANWLPFAFVGRVMFIYHYFPSLAISLIALGWVGSSCGLSSRWAAAWAAGAFAMFAWMSPVVYGIPQTPSSFQARMLLPSWR